MLIDKSPGLKNAVLNLPPNEKDKLLLKLISKDVILLSQLEHQLLEDDSDLDERIGLIKQEIGKKIGYINRYIDSNYNYSAGYLMMDIREMNGLVNQHLLITKHKLSEIDLRIFLLESVISCSAQHYFNTPTRHNEKLFNYFAGRIKYILEKFGKLHEDVQFDFSERLNGVLKFAHQTGLKSAMEALALVKEV